jgi:hypothetical protein
MEVLPTTEMQWDDDPCLQRLAYSNASCDDMDKKMPAIASGLTSHMREINADRALAI